MDQAVRYMLKKFAVFAVLAALFSALAYPIVVKPQGTEALKSNDCLNMGSADAKITVSGNVATAKFTIPVTNPRCLPREVTLASYMAPNPTDGKPYSAQKLYKHTTKIFKNSGPHSLTVAVPDCYYQIDLARGKVMSNFTDSTYYQETRLLGAKHGGNKSCEQPKPAKTTPAPATPATPEVDETEVCTALTSKYLTQSGKLPAKVEFDVKTSGNNNATAANSFKYDFGDGSTGTSSTEAITHEYTKPGTYKVTATPTQGSVSNNNGGGGNQNNEVCTTEVVINPENKIVTAGETRVVEKPAEPSKTLPNTGPGDAIAVGSAVSFVATFGHMLIRRREELLASIITRL